MIYVLEDDESILNLLKYTLSSAGYECEGFALPSLFLSRIEERKPDLVLLDIMLPEMSGVDVLKTMRKKHHFDDVRIIMLTAKSAEYDIVKALDEGADDYITKPFGMMELLARVKSALRRKEKRTNLLSSGAVTIDDKAHLVTVNGNPVSLTLKEYETLKFLMENEGICMSREKILSTVWGYSFDGENRTVDVHIRRIREKLKDEGKLIHTISGVGYKFDATK